MKEAPVRRVTWNPVAAFPRSIDFRRHPFSTSGSTSTTIAICVLGEIGTQVASGGPTWHIATPRWEWERPYTVSWRPAMADDDEGMSEKSRHRLAPVLTEASFMDVGPTRAKGKKGNSLGRTTPG
jgi:hypothetical protein